MNDTDTSRPGIGREGRDGDASARGPGNGEPATDDAAASAELAGLIADLEAGAAAFHAAAPTSDEAIEIAARLHSAAIHLLRALRREDTALGISAAALSALSVVGFGGRRTLSELAVAEQVSRPSITRIVSALERDGLVQRVAEPADGRVAWVEITPAGREILQQGPDRRTARLADQLRTLSAADRATIARTVDLLERLLHDLG